MFAFFWGVSLGHFSPGLRGPRQRQQQLASSCSSPVAVDPMRALHVRSPPLLLLLLLPCCLPHGCCLAVCVLACACMQPPRVYREPVIGPPAPGDAGKKTLVLDLDETLVHSSFKVCLMCA